MKKADVFEFYRRLAEDNPSPETELQWTNPYTLLVAVALSAQATDVGVNKATKRLFAQVDTPEQMVALGEAALKEHIKTIGLFNTKAKNVIALSEKLLAEHGGERGVIRQPGHALGIVAQIAPQRPAAIIAHEEVDRAALGLRLERQLAAGVLEHRTE